MSGNSGVRISRQDLTRSITLYLDQIPEATQAGLEDALDAGAHAMVQTAEKAVTKTGRLRHPSTPGRHETGNLVAEFVDLGEAGGATYSINSTRGGNFHVTFGILDPETLTGHSGNPYLAAQELGTGPGGPGAGRGHGIPAMHAVQAGFNIVASRVFIDIATQLAELGRDAEAGRMFSRARRQATASDVKRDGGV